MKLLSRRNQAIRTGAVRSILFWLAAFFALWLPSLQSMAAFAEATVALRGQVVDASGKPVAEARVAWHSSSLAHEAEQLKGASASDGSFQIALPNETPGRPLRFWVYKPGFEIEEIRFLAGSNGSDKLQIVRLNRPKKSQAFHCKDENGLAIAGVRPAVIAASDPNYESQVQLDERILRCLEVEIPESNAQGLLEIPWLGDGDWQIGFGHPDFAQTSRYSLSANSENTIQVRLQSGEEVGLAVVTSGARRVDLSQARVVVEIESRLQDEWITVPIDAHGRGQVRLVHDGRATTMTAHHPELATLESESFIGKRIYTFQLFGTAEVSGRVIDVKTQAGVANVKVNFDVDKGYAVSAMTDAEGNYKAEIAGTSVYLRVASQETWRQAEQTIHEIQARAGQTIRAPDLFVSKIEPVQVQVVSNGLPVPNAVLEFVNEPEMIYVCDLEGRYKLPIVEDKLVYALDPWEGRSTVSNVKDGSRLVQLELASETSVVGMIRDKEKRPVSGANISVHQTFRKQTLVSNSGFAVSREDGTFRFTGLCEGLEVAMFTVEGWTSPRWIARPEVLSRQSWNPRTPLEADSKMMEELNRNLQRRAAWPKKLLGLETERWFNSAPLTQADLAGRSVIMFDVLRQSITSLKVADQLYRDNGLMIIGVFASHDAELNDLEVVLEKLQIKFPVVVDDGAIANRFSSDSFPQLVLYDSNGELVPGFGENPKGLLRQIRNHILHHKL